MRNTEQAINIKATIWTTLVHVLLFLLFIYWRYSVPAPPTLEELGMEVNLGNAEDGSGLDQPQVVNGAAADGLAVNYESASAEQAEAKDLLQSDDPDAPAIASPNANSLNNEETRRTSRINDRQSAEPDASRAQPTRPRYVYNGGTGAGGNNAAVNASGSSEGNTTGSGDRGVPGGTPGASNYAGSPGSGTGGISHTLAGRDISPKQFVAEFNQGGKVVVRVTVDREGRIIAKSIKSSPNSTLSAIALQKLSEARFTRNPDAAPEQIGDITFVFKTRSQ